MGVSCDRLKLGSTVALNCQTGQSKGRYFAKKSSHFYLLRCSVPWIQMCKIIIFLNVHRALLNYSLWAFLGWHSKIGGICHPQNELQMA